MILNKWYSPNSEMVCHYVGGEECEICFEIVEGNNNVLDKLNSANIKGEWANKGENWFIFNIVDWAGCEGLII